MATIDRWIRHWADHRPTSPALWFEGAVTTYADLAVEVRIMVDLLVRHEVKQGDRVVFCGLNRIEHLTALFACSSIGAIQVPLNNRLSVAEHAFQIDDAEPRLALVTDGFGQAVARAAPELTIVDLDDISLDERPEATEAVSPGGVDDPVLMVYTSGTTGRPKGTVHTQSSLLHTVLNGVAQQDLSVSDRILTSLPLFHVGGLNIQTLPALYVGAVVLLQRRFDPGEALDIIARQCPTQFLAVPAMLSALLDHPAIDTTDLSCLVGLNTGSSVVPEHLIRGFANRGVPVGQVYGATETGPTAVVLRYEDGLEHIGSCGKPALHTEVRVVDDSGVDVATGDAGEVWLRGPSLFHSYWKQPEATADAFSGGWYRTGDVGRRDPDGYLFIEDRVKDMLISGGENVYPAEVENVLVEHPDIAEVAVIGRPDQRWGEVPVAVVVPLASGGAPTVEDLRHWCIDRLARYKQPAEIVVVETLPRTALGKVTKHVLRAELFGSVFGPHGQPDPGQGGHHQ